MNPEYQKVRFRAKVPDALKSKSFGVITACNPDGITVSDAENKTATQKLRSELVHKGLVHFPVTGGSQDFSHAELGFGVVCGIHLMRLSLGEEHSDRRPCSGLRTGWCI